MTFAVEYFTLASADATSKYVVLGGTPVDPASVALDLISGTSQAIYPNRFYDGTRTYGNDYGVVDSTVLWNDATYALFSELVIGDQLRVIYDRS